MLHNESIDPATLELLIRLMDIPEFSELNLVGGTSLALQIGHRKSVDLDLFGQLEVDDFQLSSILQEFSSVKLLNNSQNIKVYLIEGVKVDFVNYPYSWLEPNLKFDKIRLAGKKDIAAMKLSAITGRGTKKDFIDIYFLLNYFSLAEMFQFYQNKFPDGSDFLVTRSLLYFVDAEKEQLPFMLSPVNWEKVKTRITKETKLYIESS